MQVATQEETKSRFEPSPKPSDPKQPPPKPGDPHQPAKPGEPHTPHTGEEKEQGGRAGAPAPRATAASSLVLSHSSCAPGPVWFELSNPTAFALTVGANTFTASAPAAGAGWWSQYFNLPLMCAVFTPATFTPDPGLPVPQSAVKLTNTPGAGLPAGAGVQTVTVTGTPPTITVTVNASAAGTVAAGSRWFVFSVIGV